MPAKEEIPSTLKRSDEHAQAIWSETHDSAVESYGEGERAHRTAFSALKHQFEKVGDHWEPKDENGPSDAGAARAGRAARHDNPTAGGVDANASKAHLLDLARRLDARTRGASQFDNTERTGMISHEDQHPLAIDHADDGPSRPKEDNASTTRRSRHCRHRRFRPPS